MTGDAVDHGVGGRETRRDLVVAGLAQHDPGDPRLLAVVPADGPEGAAAPARRRRGGRSADHTPPPRPANPPPPPAVEPVLAPTNPSCPSNVLVLCTVPATGSVALGVATMVANTGRRIARSTRRTWSAAVDTVASSEPLGAGCAGGVMPQRPWRGAAARVASS